MLKAGGNAVDAAVAAAFAIGVVEPNATGLGGEGMMVIYLAGKKTAVAIDYRSAAPATASFPKGIPSTGHAAVAVPGTVAGLTLALQKYGTMPLAQVLAPAIRLAEEGFVVSPTLAGDRRRQLRGDREERAALAGRLPAGLPIEAGATLKNPDLAASLRKIGSGGADVFYRGAIADAIAAEMAAHGGFITKADLAAYRAIERAAGPRPLPRLRHRLGAAAGRRPVAGRDPPDPRPLRPAEGAAALAALRPPGRRGHEARLRRLQRLHRRPGLRAVPVARAALARLREDSARPRSIRRRSRRRWWPASPRERSRRARPRSRSWTRRATWWRSRRRSRTSSARRSSSPGPASSSTTR